MVTLQYARQEMVKSYQQHGLEDAAFEVRQLLLTVLQTDQAGLLGKSEITAAQWQTLCALLERRVQGEPLQYVLGEWDFYGRRFMVGEGVLIPRADTEVLCEVALRYLQDKPRSKIADLCAGSGCIAITLAQEITGSRVVALEYSKEAFCYLQKNIGLHQSDVTALLDDVLHPTCNEESFDLIISNPPYLNEEDMRVLQREVQFEPEMALYAPENGYLFYQEIPSVWKSRLKKGGMLCFEVGIGQADTVAEILHRHDFFNVTITPDLQGIARVVSGIK